MKTPELSNNSKQFDETNERTAWDTLGDKEVDIKATMNVAVEDSKNNLPDDIPESTETSSEYAATNDEIFKDAIKILNDNIYIAKTNGIPPEKLHQVESSRDLFVDAYFETTIDSKDGSPAPSIADVLRKRQSIQDLKVEYYTQIGDNQSAEQAIQLSNETAELIQLTSNVQKSIEVHKDPNSFHNKNASAFQTELTPKNPDILSTDAIV